MAFVEYKGEILPYSFEDKAIDKVLELEGGYNPKDPVTGMPVKYGIDQRANPDIDVSKLTKEDARRIYRDRYWAASGASELPEKLALVHFDAAVNQGPEKAKQLLEASGGDPDKYVELRKAEYQRLAEQNPEKYGSSLKGWMNRLDSLQKTVAPTFEEYTGEIIPLDKSLSDRALDIVNKTVSPVYEGIKALAEPSAKKGSVLEGTTLPEETERVETPKLPGFEHLYPSDKSPFNLNEDERTQKLILQGLDPEFARATARRNIAEQVPTTGREYGIARPLTEEEEAFEKARQDYKEGTVSRIGGKSKEQFKSSVYGGLTFIGDMAEELGAEEFGQRLSGGAAKGQKESKAILRGIGDNPNRALDFLETGVSGAINNALPFLAGPMAGLTTMGTQVFGQEYGEGRDAGLDKADAIARASAMTSAELIGESISLPGPIFNAFKNFAKGLPVDEIMPAFAKLLIKENLSEQVTTALQFSADKFAPFGINKDSTLEDYLRAVKDTFYQTMAQTMVTGGAGVATGKLAKSLGKKPEKEEAEAKDFDIVPSEIRTTAAQEAAPEVVTEPPKAPDIVTAPVELEEKPKATLVPASPSQNTDVMMAELEGRLPKAPVEETAPVEKIAMFKDYSKEDQKAIRKLEAEKNKIKKEKKLFVEFLTKQGVQPSEKADLGLEGISRPRIFRDAAPSFDELTSRAINQGFLLPSGDDVQDVANMREHVANYIGSGQITTGPDTAREAQLNSLDEAIQEIVRKYEKPSFGLEQPTPADLRAREEATKLREAEAARIEEEDKARRDREEIARLSQESEFALGRTAAEDLMGQKNIFEQPADIEAEMAKKADEDKAEAERIRQQGGEDADIPFLNIKPTTAYPELKFSTDNPGGSWLAEEREYSKSSGTKPSGAPKRFGSTTGYFKRNVLVPVSVLSKIKGINSEQENVREGSLTAIKEIMDKTDKLPQYDNEDYVPFINVDQTGTPYINEGNHRVMAADSLGFKYLPVEIRYYSGGEQESGVLSPDLVRKYDKEAFDAGYSLENYSRKLKEKPVITLDIGKERKAIISRNEEIREEKIREKQSLAQRKAAVDRRFVKDKSKKGDMINFKILSEQIDLLDEEIDDLYEEDRRPVAFLNRANKALADKKDPLSQDVFDVLFALYKKNPQLLDGLKLSVTKLPEGKSAAGEFKHLQRIVRLYKETSGMEDPATLLHELTHTLEQMMKKGAKKALAAKWGEEFKRAYLAEKTTEGKEFFQAVMDMLAKPSDEAFEKAVSKIPALPDGQTNYKYYQFISPSEYWAVNATPLMQAYMGTSWQKFKNSVKALFETLKDLFGVRNNRIFYQTFNQVINGPRLGYTMLNHYISESIPTMNIHRNYLGGQPPLAAWDAPEDSKILGVDKTDLIYKLQDKFVDLKNIEEAITKTIGEIDEKWDPYQAEALYHGRTAERTKKYLHEKLLPVIKQLKAKNLTLDQFEEYLHNRHAEERNAQIARINKDMPDGGSGIMTKDAKDYLAKLDPKQKAVMDSVAKMIDDMVYETQEILLNEGLEDAKTINTWRKTYKYYVPLERDLDVAGQTFTPGSQGYGTRGKTSKRATGSEKDVINILANLAIQREKAIMKAEKAKVGRALYGLALKHPNPEYWLPVNPDAINDPKALAKELQSLGLKAEDAVNFIKEPVIKMVKDGVVVYAPNINDRFADSVFPIRINGKDRFIFFNTKNPSAVRLVKSLKNIDVQQLAGIVGMTAKITRFVAAMNTQYNPVFGAWNFARDVSGALLNISTTPIADRKAEVLSGVFPAFFAIYGDVRAERKERPKGSKEWNDMYERYKMAGGQTGYKDQFAKTEKQADIIQREMEYLDRGNVKKTVDAIAGWLSDYNDAMENAVRLSAFKAAVNKGYSDAKAAYIAKNLTVNFNRKGAWSTGINALYAFFNAAVQGSARLYETMKGPAGRKIFAGGIFLGIFQALVLQTFGFDDDEPPPFLKDKNLIIPYGNEGKYAIIPMPLGYSAIPATGRRIAELYFSGGKNASGKIIDMMGVWADAFNPIGSGSFAQMMTPTFADPFVSADMNRDTFGRPIYKEGRTTSPVPGYMRSSDKASTISKYLSELINDITSPIGTKYVKGKYSPTADELDYIAGQYLGGVGREAKKAYETVESFITGEEIEPHRRFVSGKIFGDKESNSAVKAKFYKNVTELADHESEIKGRKAAKTEDVSEYKEEHPESRLWKKANDKENEISEINQKIKKYRAKTEDQEYYKERIKDLEEKKIEKMRDFNEKVKEERG